MKRFAFQTENALFLRFPVLRLLPGAGGRSPARRGAWSERGGAILPFFFSCSDCGCCPERATGRLPGEGHGVRGAAAPLHPLHPRTPPSAGAWKESLKLDSTPPAACRWGVGANLPGRFGRVMSAPAAALRPPCGRPGSPSRPRHRCVKARGEGGTASGGGRRSLPHARGGVSTYPATAFAVALSSPRPWGCFARVSKSIKKLVGLPHARGGVSKAGAKLMKMDISFMKTFLVVIVKKHLSSQKPAWT